MLTRMRNSSDLTMIPLWPHWVFIAQFCLFDGIAFVCCVFYASYDSKHCKETYFIVASWIKTVIFSAFVSHTVHIHEMTSHFYLKPIASDMDGEFCSTNKDDEHIATLYTLKKTFLSVWEKFQGIRLFMVSGFKMNYDDTEQVHIKKEFWRVEC